MRNIKELLEIVLEYIETTTDQYHGLCLASIRCQIESKISVYQKNVLLGYIKNNRPKIFQKGFSFGNIGHAYYWEVGDKAPRIKWLKQHIEKNS